MKWLPYCGFLITCGLVSAKWPRSSDWLLLSHFLTVQLGADRISVTLWLETDSQRPQQCSTLFACLPQICSGKRTWADELGHRCFWFEILNERILFIHVWLGHTDCNICHCLLYNMILRQLNSSPKLVLSFKQFLIWYILQQRMFLAHMWIWDDKKLSCNWGIMCSNFAVYITSSH